MQNLEVLEEQSNEENSPMIKQKKAGMMRQLTDSPTNNFVNTNSRQSSLKRSRKELFSLNEITLTNQREKIVPIVSMRSFNIEAEEQEDETLRV